MSSTRRVVSEQRDRNTRQRLQALLEISSLLPRSLEPQAVFDAAARATAALLDVQEVGVWQYDAAAELLCLVAEAPLGYHRAGQTLPVDRSVSGWALREGRPLVVPEVTRHALWQGAVERRTPPGSGLFAPVVAQDRPLGVLVAFSHEVQAFDADDLQIAEALASHVAIAIQNAQLHQALEARLARVQTLVRLNQLISSSLNLGTVLREIARAAAELVNAPLVSFWMADPASRTLKASALSNEAMRADFPYRLVRFGEGGVGWVAEHRRQLHVPDVFVDRRPLVREWWREHGYRSLFALPVSHDGTLLAVLSLVGHRPFDFGPDDRDLLKSFVAQAATAIQNARLFEQAGSVEAVRELARLKSEFVNTVSHELRTPLTLIHGYSELLVERTPRLSADDIAGMAREIHSGSTVMARLVDDLLDFSRLEQARFQLQRRDLDASDLLESIIKAFRNQPHGERICAQLADGVTVSVDPERIAQVLNNFLTNAVRYAPDGPIHVAAARWREKWLRVSVTDQGPGIAPDEQSRVWEKFFRGGDTATSVQRGSGLGLAVAKQIIELHGGKVGLESTPGQGATFWFTVPLAAASRTRRVAVAGSQNP